MNKVKAANWMSIVWFIYLEYFLFFHCCVQDVTVGRMLCGLGVTASLTCCHCCTADWPLVLLLYTCTCVRDTSKPRPLPVSPPVHSPTAHLLDASHRASVQSERGSGCSGAPVQQQPRRRPGHHHLLCHLHPHRPSPPVATATGSAEEHRVAWVATATCQRR